MSMLVDLVSHYGALLLLTASALSLALILVYIWITGGSAAERSLFHLESYRRLEELGLMPVRRRDALRSTLRRSVAFSELLTPWTWLRTDDTNWRKELQDRYRGRRRDDEPIGEFHARERRAVDDLAAIVATVSPAASATAGHPWSDRARDAFAATVRHAEASTTVEQLRDGDRPSRRRSLRLALHFVTHGDASSTWRALALELLDFLGRGTSLGLLGAILVQVDTPLLTRIAIGTAAGSGLALWLWQRKVLAGLARTALSVGSLSPRTRTWLGRFARRPGATVSAFYVLALAANGLFVLLDRLAGQLTT